MFVKLNKVDLDSDLFVQRLHLVFLSESLGTSLLQLLTGSNGS